MLKTIKALALAGAVISCASGAAAQTPGAFVDVPGGKLWYETCGSGPTTMVLIHDGVLHSVGWDDVWPTLCKSFRVVRYDRRGYGRSPEAKAPYSPLDDLQAVLDAAAMKHAVIVGASNGGGLAVDFALAHPAEVDKLVLVGPAVTGIPPSKAFMDRQAELAGRMARLDFMGAIKGSWLFPPGDDADAARLLKLLMANLHDLTHKDPAAPSPPSAGRLGEIKAPTLVVIGEDDAADNQAQAGVVEYAIPGATRVVVRKAGHLVYMTQPAEFSDLVSRFALAPGTARPGAEAALRSAIDGLQRGVPDDALFSPAAASAIRAQADGVRAALAPLGAIRCVTFKSEGPGGFDIFIVAYEKGAIDWRISLGPDGKIIGLFFKPEPSNPPS
ncbi:MAG TPA: alpha/beta hydrolase [Caulobacteraceae bacterium]|nr:alpha/beta hydrolase [Caulobacteraceae bacterium]